MKKLLTLALGLALFGSASAQAAGSFSIVGAGNYTMPRNAAGSNGFNSKLALGGGALLEFRSSPGFGLEFGGIYTPRKFDAAGAAWEFNQIQIPVVLRFHLSPYFTFGLGGYYGIAMGNWKLNGAEVTYNGSAFEKSDFGVLGSLGLRIPLGSSMRFLVDGRYIYGLKDTDKTGNELKYSDVQLLAGFQFNY